MGWHCGPLMRLQVVDFGADLSNLIESIEPQTE